MNDSEAILNQENSKKKKKKSKSSRKSPGSNSQETEEHEQPSSPSTPTAIFYSFPGWGYGAPTAIAYMGTFDSGKYKTKLCRHWKAGYCLFGTSCCFAHGFDDIQQPNTLSPQRSPIPSVTYLPFPVPSSQYPGSPQQSVMPPSPLLGMPPLLPTDLLMSPVMPSMPPSYIRQPTEEEYEEEYQVYGEYEQGGTKQEERAEGRGEGKAEEQQETQTSTDIPRIEQQMQSLSLEQKDQSGNPQAPLPAQRS